MDLTLKDGDLPYIAIMLSLATSVFMSPWLHDNDVRDGNLAATRRGESIAATIVIGSGLLFTVGTKSYVPFMLGVFLTAVYIAGIEYTVQQNASQ